MICASLSQPCPLSHPVFQRAFNFLRESDIDSLPVGRHPIMGEQMFAIVQEMTTRLPHEARNEFHRRYIDIQFLCSGEERIGYAPAPSNAPLLEDRLAERDIAFVDLALAESTLHLHPGMYAVFFPGELHAPCLAVQHAAPIRKVVIKIDAALLG